MTQRRTKRLAGVHFQVVEPELSRDGLNLAEVFVERFQIRFTDGIGMHGEFALPFKSDEVCHASVGEGDFRGIENLEHNHVKAPVCGLGQRLLKHVQVIKQVADQNNETALMLAGKDLVEYAV